ncbi:acyltransferase family protein [Megamonas sp.]
MDNILYSYYVNLNIIEAIKISIENYNFLFSSELAAAGPIWFFRAIIPLYISLPMISFFIKSDNKYFWTKKYLLISFFLVLLPSFFETKFVLNMLSNSIFSVFTMYFILGYLIYKNIIFYNVNKNILIFVITLSSVVTIVFDDCLGRLSPTIHGYESSPFICISAIALFLVIKNINVNIISRKIRTIVEVISKYSMGIFLIHFPLVQILYLYIIKNYNISSRVLIIMMIFLLTMIFSMLYVNFMKRFKLTKKLVS